MANKRSIAAAIFVFILLLTAAAILALRARAAKPLSLPILMYHSVGPTNDSPWFVPADVFRAHMAELRRQGFQSILPSDLIAHRSWGKPLPSKPVMITFDDGYLCNLTVIEPILREYDLRAVIYLITSTIGASEMERGAYEGKKCLIWPEITAMLKRGAFVFGGHSHRHCNLAASEDPSSDIAECMQQLKQNGIRRPYAFCYPFGQYNSETKAAVKAAGFKTAVVCEDAVAIISPETDLFALPRVSVMGGRHEFKLLAADVDRDKNVLKLRVAHSGIPLEITACLEGRETIWLPPCAIGEGEFELQFQLSNHGVKGLSHLDLWDKHRLLKLATIAPDQTPKE